MKRSKLSHKLAAAATMGMVAGSSADAFASNTTLKDAGANVITATSGFVDLVSALAYIAGAGLCLAGIFKLKQHVDNPAQAPMKDALIRLACGGMFLSLPFMLNIMQGSVSNGDNNEVDISGMKLKAASDVFN